MIEKKALPQDADLAEQFFQFIHRRTQELQKAGMTKGRANGIAIAPNTELHSGRRNGATNCKFLSTAIFNRRQLIGTFPI